MRMFTALMGALVFAGCSAGNGTVSLTAKPSTKTAALITAADGSGNGVGLSRVRLLLNEAELRGGGGGCRGKGGPGGGMMGGGQRGPAAGSDVAGQGASFCKHRGHHVEQGPFVITIDAASLASAVSEPVLLADVPAGDYRGAELEVGPLGAQDASAAKAGRAAPPSETVDLTKLGAEFDDFKTSGAAIIIEGTSNGAAFTYQAAFQAEQESATALTVAAGAEVSLGLNVDATTWFVDANGNALDPALAEHHDAIAANIQKSLTIEDDTGKGPRHP